MDLYKLNLENHIRECEKLIREYDHSLSNPQWFAPLTLKAFRKHRAKVNKDLIKSRALLKSLCKR